MDSFAVFKWQINEVSLGPVDRERHFLNCKSTSSDSEQMIMLRLANKNLNLEHMDLDMHMEMQQTNI